MNNDHPSLQARPAPIEPLAPTTPVAGFNGQLTEAATGWQILGNGYRVYNPVLMRFHSPDTLSPFGEGGLNSYAYCAGDPGNRVDPTGHLSMLAALGRFLARAFTRTARFTPRMRVPLAGKTPAWTMVSRMDDEMYVVRVEVAVPEQLPTPLSRAHQALAGDRPQASIELSEPFFLPRMVMRGDRVHELGAVRARFAARKDPPPRYAHVTGIDYLPDYSDAMFQIRGNPRRYETIRMP